MFTYLSERQRKMIYDGVKLLGFIAALVFALIAAGGDPALWGAAVASFVTGLLSAMSSANVGTSGLDTETREALKDQGAREAALAPYSGSSKRAASGLPQEPEGL